MLATEFETTIETTTTAGATASAIITSTATTRISTTQSTTSTTETTFKATTTGVDATQSTIKTTTANTYAAPLTTSVTEASVTNLTVVEVVTADGQTVDQSHLDIAEEAVSPSCEAPGSDWICSNDKQNRSLCLKRCQNGDTDEKVCICENQSCSWYHKGDQCSMNSMSNPYMDSNPDVESMNNLNIPGNLLFDSMSSSESAIDLVSLIHEINVSNIGYINVNLHLK